MNNQNFIEISAIENGVSDGVSDTNDLTSMVHAKIEGVLGRETVIYKLHLPRTEDQNQRIEKEHEERSHERVALGAQEFFEELKASGKYTKETLTLFEDLAQIQNESDFRTTVEKIMSSHNIISKKLERAVEVDYKAYLPEKAPILYLNWKKEPRNKGKNAIDCLNEIYGHYLEQGVLFQDDLGGKDGLDLALNEAIKNYCKRNKLKTSDILPPKTERTSLLAQKIDKRKALIIKGLYEKIRKNPKK